jgi:hypothetical protein
MAAFLEDADLDCPIRMGGWATANTHSLRLRGTAHERARKRAKTRLNHHSAGPQELLGAVFALHRLSMQDCHCQRHSVTVVPSSLVLSGARLPAVETGLAHKITDFAREALVVPRQVAYPRGSATFANMPNHKICRAGNMRRSSRFARCPVGHQTIEFRCKPDIIWLGGLKDHLAVNPTTGQNVTLSNKKASVWSRSESAPRAKPVPHEPEIRVVGTGFA